MKITLFLLIAVAIFSFSSCNLVDDLTEKENELNGDTDIPLNKEGNTFSTSANINGIYVDVPSSFEITKNENGIVNIAAIIDLNSIPELKKYADLIPAELKDSQGRLNTVSKYKITSEGIQDYTNVDEAPHTLVKYNCKVGDTYKLKKSDGNTITRKVTQKSTEDDFPYGFMYIKTITVEQDSRIPGISKIIYKLNHKFGIVYAEIVADDGSKAGTLVYPQNY